MIKSLIPSLIISASLAVGVQAATVATVEVIGAAPGKSSATFTNYSNGGGSGPNGTRIGIASASGNRVVAGTSNEAVWTIPEAGTITVSYYLDNTVNATFREGVQGLYDATVAIAGDAGAVEEKLNDFLTLDGVNASTTPDPIPGSLNSGSGGTGAPAVQFTTTYTINEGSDAIGMDVALDFTAHGVVREAIFSEKNPVKIT